MKHADVLQDQALAQQNSLGEQSRHQFLAPVSNRTNALLADAAMHIMAQLTCHELAKKVNELRHTSICIHACLLPLKNDFIQGLSFLFTGSPARSPQTLCTTANSSSPALLRCMLQGELNVPRDSLGSAWQDSSDVIGSAYSSPRHLNIVIGNERQFPSATLQGFNSLSGEGLSEELFGSANNSPRSHMSDIGLGASFKATDNPLLGSARHNLFRVSGLCLPRCCMRTWSTALQHGLTSCTSIACPHNMVFMMAMTQ